MATVHYIGMDVHCSTSDLAAMTPRGRVTHRWQGPTTIPAIKSAIQTVRRPRSLAIEESAMSEWLWRNLSGSVDEMIICDPRRNHLIAKEGEKDDPIDALKLADLLRGGYLKRVHHPESIERSAFKQHVAMYHDYVRQRVQQANRIMAYFRRHGVFVHEKHFVDEAGRDELLHRLPNLRLVRFNQMLLWEGYAMAADQVIRSRQRLIRVARREPQIRRFTQLPGISWIRAATFFVYIDTPWRFKSKSALWKYMGVGLERHRSGGDAGRLRVVRQSNRALKSAILGAAKCAIRTTANPFADQYERWLNAGISPRNARRNVARSLAATMWGMWKSGSDYQAEWVGSPQASCMPKTIG
jgi:transposase